MSEGIKIVLLGDSGVGKTTIVTKYVTGKVLTLPSPTIAAANLTKKVVIENHEYDVLIWDTAGQEIYRGLTPLYYRNADIAIIVFDVTRQNTFDSVDFWIDELRENVGDKITIVICGNKIDLEEKREVEAEKAESFASDNNALYVETSGVDGVGIESVFERGIRETLKSGEQEITLNKDPNLVEKSNKNEGCC
jgi:small GTP-binding protein